MGIQLGSFEIHSKHSLLLISICIQPRIFFPLGNESIDKLQPVAVVQYSQQNLNESRQALESEFQSRNGNHWFMINVSYLGFTDVLVGLGHAIA
jgi:hypothetical protein